MATLSQQFQKLRVRIENSLEAPYALVISSALRSDGKSVCAHGLAGSLAAAGYRTLLVDLDHEEPGMTGLPAVTTLSTDAIDRGLVLDAKTGITMLSLAGEHLCAGASKESAARLVAHLRGRFDAIVFDTARLSESSIGILFAKECDAVILTTKEGRSVRSEDHATMDVLTREGVNFFGVVTVGARTIANFNVVAFKPQARTASTAIGVARLEPPVGRSLTS